MFSDKLHVYMNKNNMRSPSSKKKPFSVYLSNTGLPFDPSTLSCHPCCYSTFPRPPLLPLLPVDPDHCRVMMYSPAVKALVLI